MTDTEEPQYTKPEPIPINAEVARMLDTIAGLMEFKGENPFKMRAYNAGADAVEDLKEPVSDFVARGGEAELQKISGIGKAISKQIVEFVTTGTSSALQELTKDLPVTVLELIKVSGIGLKTGQVLFRDFGIKSLAELKTFANGGGLKSVPGLGEKTTARVMRSIERLSPTPPAGPDSAGESAPE